MRTSALYAQLLFGHRSHVGALGSSMTHRQDNDVTTNSGLFLDKEARVPGKPLGHVLSRLGLPWPAKWQL